MSVPNSILWVLLVVVWLFVLVPILVNRRPKVMTVSHAALSTRVLFRGGFDKLKHRIRPQSPASDEPEDEEEDEDTARRPVAEVFATEHRRADHEEDLEVADEAEFVEDDVPRRHYEQEIVDDAEVVDVDDIEEDAARPSYHEDEEARADEDDEAYDEDEDAHQLARRYGRGGYNPTADASARAQRYAVRQRIVLGLLVSVIASVALSFAITPMLWYVVGALAAVLVGYLFYLRQQVRIEEQIRERRMTRYARQTHAERAAEAEESLARRGPDPRRAGQRPQPKPRAPRVVAVDEDDPDFVELASPHAERFRRASGE